MELFCYRFAQPCSFKHALQHALCSPLITGSAKSQICIFLCCSQAMKADLITVHRCLLARLRATDTRMNRRCRGWVRSWCTS